MKEIEEKFKAYQTGILGKYQFEKESEATQKAILKRRRKVARKRRRNFEVEDVDNSYR